MNTSRELLGKFVQSYRCLAVALLNAALILVILNVIAWALLEIPSFSKRQATPRAWAVDPATYEKGLGRVYPDMAEDDVVTMRKDTRRVYQEYEEYTQFREAFYESKYVNVDRCGFRHIRNQGPWPPKKGDLTIFVFGGSTTFGYGVQDGQTIPSYLQRIMRERKGPGVQVYNFGRAYYFSVQERVLLEKLIMEGFIPDVAIFIDGVNDFLVVDGNLKYTPILAKFMEEGDAYPERELLRRIPLAKALAALVPGHTLPGLNNSTRTDGKIASRTHTSMEVVADRYRRNKEMTETVARKFGIIPIFVWQPVAVYQYEMQYNVFAGYKYDENNPNVKPGYEHMDKLRSQNVFGDNFVWLADMQRNLKKPLYVSPFHYSAEMCELIAGSICSAGMDRHLFH